MMRAAKRGAIRRPNMRRAVVLFPSGLTLGNLFFGVFAIIAASRLEFTTAGVYVMLGGICDALDGRVARATNAGTQFGEELDSLVDAITFGLAPGMIMYFAVLNRDGWDWIWVFLFAACAVMRLARFNIEQAGTAKTYFQGLPSPAAGITLASYYWFSQSWLYNYGAIADLKWHVLLRYLMAVLAFLMISNVPYPTFPRTGFRSVRALGATIVVFGSLVLLMQRRLEFFFPMALIYITFGLFRWVFSGLFERRQPTIPYDLSEGEDEEDDDVDVGELPDSQVHADRQGHRAERPARVERPRERAAPAPVATDDDDAAPRRDRKKRDRKDRPPRAERPDRPDRAERPPRADRPERTERVAPVLTPTLAAVPVGPAHPATGPAAITLGEPRDEEGDDDGFEPADADDGAETGSESSSPTAGAEAGDRPRKRKRRRRRGEKRDRPPLAESASNASGDSSSNDAPAVASGDLVTSSSESESPYFTPAAPAAPAAPAFEPPVERSPEPVSRAPEPPTPTPPPAPPARGDTGLVE